MTDVSKELLPCPFCGGEAKHMGGHVRCTNNACPVDVSTLTSLDWNTRAQPAHADVVEAVARAIANARWLRSGDEDYDCWPDHPHLHEDLKREAKAALSAIPVSGEVERLRAERDKYLAALNEIEPLVAQVRQALTPPRSIRVSDLTDEEVGGMRKPSA